MSDTPTLRFLGGTGTVTGSKYLIRANGRHVLLDCGLFQGLKELRQRNWSKPPFEASRVEGVVLSHAHIDHSGYLPLLVRNGFGGPIYCTPGTADLLGVLLPDSAHLQEEEAATANRYGYAKRKPALPLYAAQDAQATLRLIESHSLVPAFAVGRTQELIWMLRQLEETNRVPSLPVYIDSPMAINVSDIYCRHPEDHALDMKLLMDEKRCPLCCKQYHLARTADESKALNHHSGPLVIISASGMATGGRILHHLKLRLPDPRTTVLLAGFQSVGTRGRALQKGARMIRIHGQDVPVRARVATLDGLSAHADRGGLLRWLSGFRQPPRQTYTVHGEPEQAQSLADTLQSRLCWEARVARDGETVMLTR
jgi:Cft2 family RNA processing exonuclease